MTSHKERTRARILDEAARAVREHGAEGIGVANLMKRAGLTHGGFYAHFASRDDLIAHTVNRLRVDSRQMLQKHLGDTQARDGLAALIDYYLSTKTRKTMDQGCPLPFLGSEAPRLPATARANFEDGIRNFRAQLAQALDATGAPDPDALASSVLAELVGAMTLARAVRDDDEAAEMLRASREALKVRLGLQPSASAN